MDGTISGGSLETSNVIAGLPIANDGFAPDFVIHRAGSLDSVQDRLSDEELSEFMQRKEIPFMPRLAVHRQQHFGIEVIGFIAAFRTLLYQAGTSGLDIH